MSISIDIHLYKHQELLSALEAWGADDIGLLTAIMRECGTFAGDTYVLLNNELWGEYSPYYKVSELIDAAFHREDSYKLFMDRKSGYHTEGINAVELGAVAHRLGIVLDDG